MPVLVPLVMSWKSLAESEYKRGQRLRWPSVQGGLAGQARPWSAMAISAGPLRGGVAGSAPLAPGIGVPLLYES